MGLFQVTVNRLGHLLEGGASELMNTFTPSAMIAGMYSICPAILDQIWVLRVPISVHSARGERFHQLSCDSGLTSVHLGGRFCGPALCGGVPPQRPLLTRAAAGQIPLKS